jgi:SPP1 family predicted phage head-tail adaptor
MVMKKCHRKPTEYDLKVIFETSSGTADAHGHIDLTNANSWSSYSAAWAKCVSKGGREFWKVDQVNADVTHVWYVAYDSSLDAITTDDRLIHDHTVYEIVAAFNVDNADVEIEVQTKRAV